MSCAGESPEPRLPDAARPFPLSAQNGFKMSLSIKIGTKNFWPRTYPSFHPSIHYLSISVRQSIHLSIYRCTRLSLSLSLCNAISEVQLPVWHGLTISLYIVIWLLIFHYLSVYLPSGFIPLGSLVCAFAFTTQPQKTSRGRFGFPTLRVR